MLREGIHVFLLIKVYRHICLSVVEATVEDPHPDPLPGPIMGVSAQQDTIL